MDELSNRNLAGYVHCSLHCFCHAVVLPDSPDVAILRIAELSEFSVGPADPFFPNISTPQANPHDTDLFAAASRGGTLD